MAALAKLYTPEYCEGLLRADPEGVGRLLRISRGGRSEVTKTPKARGTVVP
jgi:hypothetical protein